MANRIPNLTFKVNGVEVMRVPAHIFLIVVSFQQGNMLAPEPGSKISVDLSDGVKGMEFYFDMPNMGK